MRATIVMTPPEVHGDRIGLPFTSERARHKPCSSAAESRLEREKNTAHVETGREPLIGGCGRVTRAALALLNQPEGIGAGRRKRVRSEPSYPEITDSFVARAAVDDRRSERRAADRVLQPDRETADGNRSECQPAHRQAEPERCAPERAGKANRDAADSHETECEATKSKTSHRNVADRDDALRGPRPHRQWIDPH